jgi:formylglycine-generating enzyme required for sulfatase activity
MKQTNTLQTAFIRTVVLLISLLGISCDDPTSGYQPIPIVVELVDVGGGTFKADTTPVTISSFKIDKYEVTYTLWADVRDWGLQHGYTDLPEGRHGYNPVGRNNPVTEVNWYDVVKWCNARSEKEGFMPVFYTDSSLVTIYRTGEIPINIDAVKWSANGYRLPTETEWEFAARGGTKSQGYTYSGSNKVEDVAWYSAAIYYDQVNHFTLSTRTVGVKSANELGIHDMSGNVTEWCWDSVGPTYPSGGTIDPKGPATTQSYRMYRGGSCISPELDCRVKNRRCDPPNNRVGTIGFRCAQD